MPNTQFSLLPADSQPSPKFASTAPLYNRVYANSASVSRTITQRTEVSALLRQLGISKSALIVEVGAGFGELHDVHPGYLGIEQSHEGVKRGQQELGAGSKLQQGDAAVLPLLDNSVDFLFSYATLEHVPQIEAAFAEIVRVLKPGGTCVASPGLELPILDSCKARATTLFRSNDVSESRQVLNPRPREFDCAVTASLARSVTPRVEATA